MKKIKNDKPKIGGGSGRGGDGNKILEAERLTDKWQLKRTKNLKEQWKLKSMVGVEQSPEQADSHYKNAESL